MANLKRPELKLVGNVSENFKNFELRFNDYCIQANHRNLGKDPVTERADHYKSPLLEISALRSSLPDEALSALRYTIEPQIPNDDKKKPWVWMEKLRTHYRGSVHFSPTVSSSGRHPRPRMSPYKSGKSKYAKRAAFVLTVSSLMNSPETNLFLASMKITRELSSSKHT